MSHSLTQKPNKIHKLENYAKNERVYQLVKSIVDRKPTYDEIAVIISEEFGGKPLSRERIRQIAKEHRKRHYLFQGVDSEGDF